jgi:uncharacterized repeat protein (TIGR01451 family)
MLRTHKTVGRSLRLLLAMLFAAVLVPVFAQGEPPAEPLLPNTEPTEALVPLTAATEEDAVQAALAAYATNDAAAEALAALPLTSLLQTWQVTYLPLVAKGRNPVIDPGQDPTPTPSPEPEPDGAELAVTIRARPSILVRPGEAIVYTFTLRNRGDASARETKVTVPFNPEHVRPVSTSLNSRAGDWLSELGAERYTITFGSLAAGAERSGQVTVHVSSGLPIRPSNPVVIDTRASYNWRDGAGGGSGRSNWAPVVVGSSTVHGDLVWVLVTPARGPIGTSHAFFSNRFLPGERVSAWVNVNRGAGGVRSLSVTDVANSLGEVTLRIRSTDTNPDLPRGTHQIVLAGQRSGLQGVVDFTVE